MSPKRFQALYSQQTAIARRVYDATPITDAWTVTQVMAELSRVGLPIREYQKLEGCLSSLTRSGLLDEPEKGKFRRVKVAPLKMEAQREDTINTDKQEPMTRNTISIKPAQPVSQTNPLERMAELAKRARLAASTFNALADEIETVALEIEEEFEANNKAGEKFRQLQALMREV